jgi:hypothetical protein
VEVDREDFGDASNDRVAAGEAAAIPSAISDRDDPFRIGDRVIGALQCVAHVLGHGAGYHQHIGMSRRGNEAEAEAFDVIVGIVKRVDFQLASVTRSSVDLAYGEASAKPPPRGTTNCCCEFGDRRIVRRRRLLSEWPAEQTFKKQLAHLLLSLEIVARIGTVERLVAERKIRNDIVLNDSLEQRPLKPGGIAQMASFDPAIAQAEPDQNVAAKSLDDRHAFPQL